MTSKLILPALLIAVPLALWIAYGYFSSNVEQLPYKVIEDPKEISELAKMEPTKKNSNGTEELNYKVIKAPEEYEIRQYPKHIIIETPMSNNNRGGEFSILANYIFGGNKSKKKIDMTSPVIEESSSEKIAMTAPVITEEPSEKIAMTAPVITEQPSEKIAMTAPVIMEDEGSQSKMSFVIPAEYTLETLPIPLDDRVTIREVPAKKMAVIQFSGFMTQKNFEEKKALLLEYLKRDNLEYTRIYTAGYNPPGTPPFMRRNEVWAELKE